ncbi:hypothetical protein ACFQAT_28905 [Undibacterium arcticum]|uniref:non-homologous end-joining DNA ligase LigD n=1 Tax=Undibacterium arcticum TaxID=1762892 RepID=UPI0036234D25
MALWLKEVLDALDLRSFIKTTGKTGIHVFVPIEKTISFEEAKRICELIGRHVVAAHPDEVTMEWSISKRTGKIFIDHNMNGQGRTLHAAYSPRAQPGGTFSMPIRWDELPTINPANFRITAIDKIMRGKQDAWSTIFEFPQSIERALRG